MHRDVKPENLMFKTDDELDSLRLVDFGLSTSTLSKTFVFPKCGTPGYVAPEVANYRDGEPYYNEICDMFSIGAIFYKLYIIKFHYRLTLKDLFPGSDYQETLKLNKKCQFNLNVLTLYKTPKSAADLISRMLEVDPTRRIKALDALEHPFFLED